MLQMYHLAIIFQTATVSVHNKNEGSQGVQEKLMSKQPRLYRLANNNGQSKLFFSLMYLHILVSRWAQPMTDP